MMYFSSVNPLISVFILGVFFFLIGLLSVATAVKKKSLAKNLPILLFPMIGLGIMLVSGSVLKGIDISGLVTPYNASLLALCLAGLTCVAKLNFVASSFRKKNNWSPVDAQCIDIVGRFFIDNDCYDDSDGHYGRTLYIPVFRYSYCGNEYEAAHRNYSNVGLPKPCDCREIYVNPDNPTEIYMHSVSQILIPIFILIVAALFLLPTLIHFILAK